MSLCPQCRFHGECSQSGLPDYLVRNILFMTTSFEEEEDLRTLVTILYQEEFKHLGVTTDHTLDILTPLAKKCLYLT